MKNVLRYLAQALLYVPLMAIIGYFSTSPAYHHLAPGQALIRLSISHAAQRKAECRERTPEELAKLSPNMRAPLDCPRERAPVTVELDLDGQRVVQAVALPSGLTSPILPRPAASSSAVQKPEKNQSWNSPTL